MATGWRPAQNRSLVPRDGSRRLQLGAWLCQLGSADCMHTTAASLRYPRLLLPGFGTPGWALCQDTDISGGCLVLLHPRVGASMGGLQSGLGDPALAPRVSCGQLLGHAGFASSPGSAACLLPSPRRGKLWLCNLLRGLDPFLQLVLGKQRGDTQRGCPQGLSLPLHPHHHHLGHSQAAVLSSRELGADSEDQGKVVPFSGAPGEQPFPDAQTVPKPSEPTACEFGVQGRKALEAACSAALPVCSELAGSYKFTLCF